MSDTNPAFLAPAEPTPRPTPPVDQSTADGAPESQPTVEEVDYREKFEAQQRVNKDLEAKLRKSANGDGHARAKELEAELAAIKAKAEGREAEHKATLEAQRVKDEALSAANDRILKAEIRVAAAGKLNDPQDALRFLDLSAIEVGADGEVDSDAVASLIADLITDKPYLAAAQGSRFQGGADGGARKEPISDIDGQIAAATAAGQHLLAIQLKQQRAALAANKS